MQQHILPFKILISSDCYYCAILPLSACGIVVLSVQWVHLLGYTTFNIAYRHTCMSPRVYMHSYYR